jgi:hypothetical protein
MEWYTDLRIQLLTRPRDELHPKYHAAQALVFHERMHNIKSSSGFRLTTDALADPRVAAMMQQQTRLDGLTSTLASVFHPAPLNLSTGGQRTGGAARGSQVDREIHDLVVNNKIPESGFQPFTVKTLDYLRRNKLQPFATQVPVYSEELGLATTLDILALDPEGKIVHIQLKTMGSKNYRTPRGRLMSPYCEGSKIASIVDCHYTRHQLQLLVERLIVQKGYGFPITKSRLVVITEDVHSIIPLDPIIKGVAEEVWSNLMQRKRGFDDNPGEDEKLTASVAAAFRSKNAHSRVRRRY